VITRPRQRLRASKPGGLILNPPPTPCQPSTSGRPRRLAGGGSSHDPALPGHEASREAWGMGSRGRRSEIEDQKVRL